MSVIPFTPRVESHDEAGIATFDAQAPRADTYTVVAAWPSSCNVANLSALIVFKRSGPIAQYRQGKGLSTPLLPPFSGVTIGFDVPNRLGSLIVVDLVFNSAIALSGVTVTDNNQNYYWPICAFHFSGSATFLCSFCATISFGNEWAPSEKFTGLSHYVTGFILHQIAIASDGSSQIFTFEATTGGNAGGTYPDWNSTTGATTLDDGPIDPSIGGGNGTVVWTCQGEYDLTTTLTIEQTGDNDFQALSVAIHEYSGFTGNYDGSNQSVTEAHSLGGSAFLLVGPKFKSWMAGPSQKSRIRFFDDGSIYGIVSGTDNSDTEPPIPSNVVVLLYTGPLGPPPPFSPRDCQFLPALDFSDYTCADAAIAFPHFGAVDSNTITLTADSQEGNLLHWVAATDPYCGGVGVTGDVALISPPGPQAWLVIDEPGFSAITWTPAVIWDCGGTVPSPQSISIGTWNARQLDAGFFSGLTQKPLFSAQMAATLAAWKISGVPAVVQSACYESVDAINTNIFTLAFDSDNSLGNTLILDFCLFFGGGFLLLSDIVITDTAGNAWLPLWEPVTHNPPNPPVPNPPVNVTTQIPAINMLLGSYYVPECIFGPNTVIITVTQILGQTVTSGAMAVQEVTNLTFPFPAIGIDYTPNIGAPPAVPVNPSISTITPNNFLHLFCCYRFGAIGSQPADRPVGFDGGFFDRTPYLFKGSGLHHTWTQQLRQRGQAEIQLEIQAGDTYEPTQYTPFFLFDQNSSGYIQVFAGLIQDVENQYLDDSGHHFSVITGVSLESVFDTVYAEPVQYVNQTCGFIVRDLFNRFESGCPVSLGVISNGETIPLFNVKLGDDIASVFTSLATTSNFCWYIDPQTLLLFFGDPTTVFSPITLTSQDILFETLNFKIKGDDFRNNQGVRLGFDAFEHSKEFFVGSGQTTITLSRPVQQVTNAWATLSTCNTATGTFSDQPFPGDTITTGPAEGAWQTGIIYATGGVIVVNGYVQKITFASGLHTTGGPPTFSTITNQTTTDSAGNIWTCLGPLGLSTGSETYTFVTALDNSQFGEVLIDSISDINTCQNLADAINRYIGGAPGRGPGINYSLPTWENSQINAVSVSLNTFVAQQKSAGTSYVSDLSKFCPNFTWSAPATSGGTSPNGSLAPGEGGTISLQVYAQGTSTAAPGLSYQEGSDILILATPLNTGSNLNVEYTRADGDSIVVEDSALVASIALLTHGTGKYQRFTDQSSQGLIATSRLAGLQFAQQLLALYKVPPKIVRFSTYVTGLQIGQTLPISITTPVGASTLLNGNWLIESIEAEFEPIDSKNSTPYIPGGGHYKYSLNLINVSSIGSYLDFWTSGSTGGGGGSGGGGGGSQLVATSGGAAPSSGSSTPGGVQVKTADYTLLASDSGSLMVMNSSGAHTFTLPAFPPSFTWEIWIENIGTGNLTVSPNSLNLDGSGSSLVLVQNSGCYIATDGANYFTSRGSGVTHLTGALTADLPVFGAGGADIKSGTKSGNTNELASVSGTLTSGNIASFDGSGNVIDSTASVAKLSQEILTTKGDLLSWGSAPSRLGVGSNTQVLTADSTQALGIKWAAAASGTGGVSVKTADYTAVSGDNGTLLVMNSASVHTITLPASPPSATWFIAIQNIGAGTLTVSRNGLTIDGAASNLTIAQGSGVLIFTDNSNYFTERGLASGSVTSVGLSLPAELTVSGSPVTGSGTLSATWANENANQVFAGPSSGGATTPSFRALVSADLPTGSGASAIMGSATAVALTTTIYIPIAGGGLSSTTEANVDIPAPTASVLSNFYVELSAAPGLGNSVVVTIRKNAADTALTLTISGAAVSGSDLTHTVAVAAGDLLDIKIVPTGTIVATPNFLTGLAWASTSGAGPGALTLISSQTLSGAVATVTFSSIPNTFTHLQLVINGATNHSSANEQVTMALNGDTTQADYSEVFLAQTGNLNGQQNNNIIGSLKAATGPSNASGSITVTIPNYVGTTFLKTFMASSFSYTGSSLNNTQRVDQYGTWNNAAAITSIVLGCFSGGSFIAGSQFSLYGVS